MASGYVQIDVDGQPEEIEMGITVLQAIIASGKELPHVCYHPALGPIETCDTCITEVNGKLMRACATPAMDGMDVRTNSVSAKSARKEAMDRILRNHELYCTVCDNNNGNCTVHNTAMMMKVEHQKYPFEPKPYEQDN